jgi:nucleotide-binding universal stress UspA family protein
MWTYPPRHILTPVDFGEASSRALKIAAIVAARHQSTVTALHAETLEVPPYFTHDQLASVERHRAAARGDAELYLAAFVGRAIEGAATRLVDGPPIPAILAASGSADLVVMGTHGRRGPSRWWLGSVAERVVREARVPVLVTRAAASGTDPSQIFHHVVGVAGPEFDGEARHYAEQLASSFGARIGEKTVRALDDLECDPQASMMVVGLGRHHGHAWFGDIAERLVRACTLPMLFVPTGQ